MTTTYIIIAVVVLVVLWMIFAYNGFVTRINRAKEAVSDIDVQTKRRYDLIPNLVNTVKGYATHESAAFENVTKARAAAMGATAPADKAAAENQLTGALKSLFAVSEAYPDLKANQNFLQLQGQLEGIENDIRASRQTFNTAVNSYNVKVRSFPMNILGGIFGFHAKEGFKADPGAENAPKVKF